MKNNRIVIAFTALILLSILSFIFISKRRASEKQRAEIHGIDSNNNGIRDEIEVLIEKESGSEKVKYASFQLARAMQRAVENPEQALKIVEDFNKADNCFEFLQIDLDKNADISEKIEAATTDNPERAQAYLRFNLNLSGHILGGAPAQRSDCDFVTEALKK